MRLEQASSTHAQIIGLACPFCLQMIEDARRGLESLLQSKDVIELLAEAL
jgi:Fe-S oxidoreductase